MNLYNTKSIYCFSSKGHCLNSKQGQAKVFRSDPSQQGMFICLCCGFMAQSTYEGHVQNVS